MVRDVQPAFAKARRLLLIFLIAAAAIVSWVFVLWALRSLLRDLGG